MTLDDFAVLVQKDLEATRKEMRDGFAAVYRDMATKDDLKGLATKQELDAMRAEMATKEDLAAVSDRISIAKEELQEQISGLKYAKEIDEIRARVNVLERKVGIHPTRRAA